MVDFNIATGKEQPLNRTGIENVQVSGSQVQGTLVGVTTPSGASTSGLYSADAAAGADHDGDGTADGPLKALGVLLPREIIPENVESYVPEHPWDDVQEQIYKEERTLTGDRATFVKYGIELVNDDDDTTFTPGEPVYLDKGGGFTQDLSTHGPGDLVQKVGVALDPMDEGQFGNNTKDRILLDVEDEGEVITEDNGEAVKSGDGSTGGQTFTVAHGLSQAPSEVTVTPTSTDASGDHYVSNRTATDFDVTYPTAPASGTDNVTFLWTAQE